MVLHQILLRFVGVYVRDRSSLPYVVSPCNGSTVNQLSGLGLCINGLHVGSTAHADDIRIPSSTSVTVLNCKCPSYKTIYRKNGLYLNIDKCEILVWPRDVGSQPNIDLQGKTVAVKDSVKLLGCWLSTSSSSDASILENITKARQAHIMEHHWTNANPPTPENFIKLVTNNPERALQAGQHIHRTLWNNC